MPSCTLSVLTFHSALLVELRAGALVAVDLAVVAIPCLPQFGMQIFLQRQSIPSAFSRACSRVCSLSHQLTATGSFSPSAGLCLSTSCLHLSFTLLVSYYCPSFGLFTY